MTITAYWPEGKKVMCAVCETKDGGFEKQIKTIKEAGEADTPEDALIMCKTLMQGVMSSVTHC